MSKIEVQDLSDLKGKTFGEMYDSVPIPPVEEVAALARSLNPEGLLVLLGAMKLGNEAGQTQAIAAARAAMAKTLRQNKWFYFFRGAALAFMISAILFLVDIYVL